MPVQGNDNWRIARLEEITERHDKDLYRGNGKPGMTTRMEKVEEALTSIKFYGRWLLLLVGGILIKEVIALAVLKH